jgi:death-on-curing protein
VTLYLKLEQVLEIHDSLLIYGGLPGVRDLNLLISALDAPKVSLFGNEMYLSLPEKAAAYLYHLARNHPFLDANKRTAYTCTLIFLEINDFEYAFLREDLEKMVIEVANGRKCKKEIVDLICSRYGIYID